MEELIELVVTAIDKIKNPCTPWPGLGKLMLRAADAVERFKVMDGKEFCVSFFEIVSLYKLESTTSSPARDFGDVFGMFLNR